MKKLDIIFNLPITLTAILLIRLVTNKYQLSSATNILTQSQIDSYRKNGILMMDWQIFPADKLEEISTILISKVCNLNSVLYRSHLLCALCLKWTSTLNLMLRKK